MNTGFITIHRKILEWEWYDHIPTKTLFIHCLLRANHKSGKWRGQAFKRGEFITSIKTLSIETGLSEKQVRTSLDNLISTNELGKQSTSRNTVISILNYDLYQSNGKPNGEESSRSGQSKGKSGATDNNVNNNNNENNDKEKPLTPKGESFDFKVYLETLNEVFDRKFKVVSQDVKRKMKNTLKEYTKQNVWIAIQNCKNDDHHKESNYKYCTPEFFSRKSTLERHGDKLRKKGNNTYQLIDL